MKSLMEEKQLDFNQPLLSVRRFSPKVAYETEKKSKTGCSNSSIRLRLPRLPAYKPDLKSGPVSHPGAVPFMWEQTPGRPKNEGKFPTLGGEQPPLAPNLPPRIASRVKHHQDSHQVSKGSAISKSATKQKILKEVIQEKDSSDSDDDGDEAYHDALDTLSTTESFFMNCSASGLSSGLEDDQQTQPFGSFSGDQQARNFMISQFLPAAKAIASRSPQYASRKPPVVREEPREVKEVVLVSRQRHSPLRQIVLSQYAEGIGEEDGYEDEDDYESDGSENNATKVCWLFPRLCFLNPLPKLRMEGRVLSSAATHNGTRKEHAGTSHREKKSVHSQFGFREGKDKNGIDPQRRGSRKLSACECAQCDFGRASPVIEETPYIDSVHKVKSHSNSSSSTMKDPSETSFKDSDNCEKPSIIVPRMPESLDLPFTCSSDRSVSDTQILPLEDEINLDKALPISNPKVAQCKKTLFDNSVMSNQENFDGPIQNPSPRRRSRLASGDVEVDLKSLLAAHSTNQECSKGVSNVKTYLENQCQTKPGNEEAIDLRLPLSLPLPKAPSESWLKRTLPPISSSNVAANIPAPSRIASNTATHDPTKWERIVKSSEEILPTIPED